MTARTALIVAASVVIVAVASVRGGDPGAPLDPAVAGSAPGTCPPCHAPRPPAWHDDEVTDPGRDPSARRAHVQAADERGGCADCHAVSFAIRCGGCHQPTEAWVEARR